MAADRSQPTLIFVYNADSSVLAQTFDFLHKAVSPETYACNLCRVTYGAFGAKKEWSEFIRGLPCRAAFLHRDELQRRYPQVAATPLPAIFLAEKDEDVKLLVSAAELNRQKTVKAMKSLILSKLS